MKNKNTLLSDKINALEGTPPGVSWDKESTWKKITGQKQLTWRKNGFSKGLIWSMAAVPILGILFYSYNFRGSDSKGKETKKPAYAPIHQKAVKSDIIQHARKIPQHQQKMSSIVTAKDTALQNTYKYHQKTAAIADTQPAGPGEAIVPDTLAPVQTKETLTQDSYHKLQEDFRLSSMPQEVAMLGNKREKKSFIVKEKVRIKKKKYRRDYAKNEKRRFKPGNHPKL